MFRYYWLNCHRQCWKSEVTAPKYNISTSFKTLYTQVISNFSTATLSYQIVISFSLQLEMTFVVMSFIEFLISWLLAITWWAYWYQNSLEGLLKHRSLGLPLPYSPPDPDLLVSGSGPEIYISNKLLEDAETIVEVPTLRSTALASFLLNYILQS